MTSCVSGNNLPKVLLLTKQLHSSPVGGRELLCKLNHQVLVSLYGERLLLIQLQTSRIRGVRSFIKAFQGHIDGLTDEEIDNSLKLIQTDDIEKVFVDGSNLGGAVKIIKQQFSSVEVTTFFHNVEAKFFLGSLKQVKTLRALAVLLVNYLAERKSVLYSDKLICLSERDSSLLQRLYGRKATHISSISLEDKLPNEEAGTSSPAREKFALFVGGVFYANKVGITWFVKHVVPNIRIKLCVVGKGFEGLKDTLELAGKVEVIGSVNTLANWYRDAHFVIAPIFDGSGMKTKVAEALMYGKKVIGTPEAFSGYEDVVKTAGWQCVNVGEFVAAIESAQSLPLKSFDPALRALYEQKYSLAAARKRLTLILQDESMR
jgi:glycosyltransferase involved in cell wall biosynthesis